jgi:metal-responsive CopG/Arc/MetJ family transcriptional regulator
MDPNLLAYFPDCGTMCHMRATANIDLGRKLLTEVDRFAAREGMTRSELIRECVRKQLILKRIETLRARAVAEAIAHGFVSEKDMDAVLK